MTSAEHPITRSELREELRHYATKEDLNYYRAELREELRHYATKEDLANLETRLTREIADFKGEIKSDVADLRAEVKGEISTLIKWMVGVQIGGIAAIAAITTAVIAIAKVIGV